MQESRKAKPVVAFTRGETWWFPSLNEAAVAFDVNRKIILDKINDGTTLKCDGYTTFDWALDD
jgi:hypothetical protein